MLLKKIPLRVIAKKVKGRIEGRKRRLNKYEKLNAIMGTRAKKFRKHMERKEIYHSPMILHDDQFAIFIDNCRISLKIEDAIKMHIQGGIMIKKIIDKGDITELGVKYTDWEATGQAAKSMTAHEKLWLAKCCSGFSLTASQMWCRELSRRKKEEKIRLEKNRRNKKTKRTETMPFLLRKNHPALLNQMDHLLIYHTGKMLYVHCTDYSERIRSMC